MSLCYSWKKEEWCRTELKVNHLCQDNTSRLCAPVTFDWSIILKHFLVFSQSYYPRKDPRAKNCLIVCIHVFAPDHPPVLQSNTLKFEILNADVGDFLHHQILFYMARHVQKWYSQLWNTFYFKNWHANHCMSCCTVNFFVPVRKLESPY